jgi:hypothetical protein
MCIRQINSQKKQKLYSNLNSSVSAHKIAIRSVRPNLYFADLVFWLYYFIKIQKIENLIKKKVE